MKSFEERREEYISNLRNNTDVLRKIVENNKEKEDGQKNIDMLLSPIDEKELRVASNVFTYFCDAILLTEHAADCNVKELPLGENLAGKLIAKLIIELKKGNRNIKAITEGIAPRSKASIMYDFLVGSCLMDEEFTLYLAQTTGFDLDDDLDLIMFYNYYTEATSLLSEPIQGIKIESATEDDINNAEEYIYEFHRLVMEGLNYSEDYQETKQRTL